MKLAHAADLHIDSALSGLDRYEGAPTDRIRGATRRAMDQVVVTNLLAWGTGKPPLTPVPETPWPPRVKRGRPES